jgi:DNA-directed RNA polymerase specialized sigma24 family protein
MTGPEEQAANVVALDDALNTLQTIDARQSEIVELRFFAGLSIEETAEVLEAGHGDARLDIRACVAAKRDEPNVISKPFVLSAVARNV